MPCTARALRARRHALAAMTIGLVGCLPLDAELPAVPPFDAGAVDARPDAAPPPDASPPDGSPHDPDSRPTDAAPLDAAPDAIPDAAALDATPDLGDIGPLGCPADALDPGPARALVGPRDGHATGVDPTALAFLGGDLYVLDGLNRRILRVAVADGSIHPVAGEVPGDAFDRLRPPAEHVTEPLLDLSAGAGALFALDRHRVMRLDPATGGAAVVQMQTAEGPRPLALPGGPLARLAFQPRRDGPPRLILAGPEPWPAGTWAAECAAADCRTVRPPERFGGSLLDGNRQCNDDPRRGDRVVYDEVRAIAADPTQVAAGVRGRSRTPSNGCSAEFEFVVRKDALEETRYNKVPCDTPACDTRVDPGPWVDMALWGGDIYAVEAGRNRVIRFSVDEQPPESVIANPLSSGAPADDGACAALTGFVGLRSIAIDADGLVAVGSRGRVELLEAADGCGGDLARRRLVGLPDDAPADPIIGRPGTTLRLADPRALAVLDDVLHIADRAGRAVHRIARVDGRLLEPVRLGAGSGPTGLALHDGRIWGVASDIVAVGPDESAPPPRLFSIDPGADITAARLAPWGPGPTCRVDADGLYAPLDIAAGDGGLYAADLYRLRRFAVDDGAPGDFADLLAAPPPVETACVDFEACVDDRPCAADAPQLEPLADGEALSMVAADGPDVVAAVDGRSTLWRCDADGCRPEAAPGRPTALTADADGLLLGWIDDAGGHRLGRADGAALAGCAAGDCARSARDPGGRLDRVAALTVDPRDDAVLIAEGDRVRALDRAADRITALAGARDPRGLGPFFGGWLPAPGGIAARGDGRWIVAGHPGRLFALDPLANTSAALAGDPRGAPPEPDDPCDGSLRRPAFDRALNDDLGPVRLPDERLLLVDPRGARLWLADRDVATLACAWQGPEETPPTSAAVDPATGALYVALGATVHRFDLEGDALTRGPMTARLGNDKGRLALAVGDGVLYIGTGSGSLFTRDLSDDGLLAVVEPVEAAAPGPLVALAAGLDRIWFATPGAVWRYDPGGRLTAVWPRGAPPAHTCIAGLALDGACGAATLVFTDRCDGAVVEIPIGAD